jgi:hypothetical protein
MFSRASFTGKSRVKRRWTAYYNLQFTNLLQIPASSLITVGYDLDSDLKGKFSWSPICDERMVFEVGGGVCEQ